MYKKNLFIAYFIDTFMFIHIASKLYNKNKIDREINKQPKHRDRFVFNKQCFIIRTFSIYKTFLFNDIKNSCISVIYEITSV